MHFLFPSLHDQAGWVAAEASSMGTPDVCLPLGGPALLAGKNAHVASLVGDLPANLARELTSAGRSGVIRMTAGRRSAFPLWSTGGTSRPFTHR